MPLPEQLPGPHADFWDWQLRAECRGVDSAVFFSPDGERGDARAKREQRAKSICAQCPVIKACRAHALAYAEPFGVWGGLAIHERRELVTIPGVRSRRRDTDQSGVARCD